MSYLWRFLSLRYWMRHRGAWFLSTLGVALGLAVFVAVQVANHSVLASFAASLDAVAGKSNLQIRGGQNGLPESVFTRIKTSSNPVLREDVRASAPLLSRTLFSPTLKTSLLVMGVDLFSEADFRDYHLGPNPTQGTDAASFGRFILDARALAVSRDLAIRHKLQIGSQITLYVGARRERFTITTILNSAQMGGAFGGDFALLDIASAQETFGELGRLSQIDLIVDEARLDEVSQALRRMVPADASVQRPSRRGQEINDLLGAFQLNLSALSCISLFVGAFLIYNAIAIAVVRRRSEVGTLRALGAARGQLMRMFCLEAAFIGLAGSVFGMALGLLLAQFALRAVSTTVSALYIAVHAREIVVPIWLWWGAPLGGVALATLAALPAAWEAADTSPREAMQRVTLHHATARFATRLAMLGIFVLLVAGVLCQPFISGKTLYAGFAASFLTLGGFALMTPLLTLWGGAVAQKLGGVWGIEGTLASAYLRRALNRSSLVIATLMVSLALSIGLSVMVRSFRQTVAGWVASSISADLYIAPATGFEGDSGPGLPPEVVRYARALPQVKHFDTIRNLEIQIGNQPVAIAANELPALASGERTLRFLQTQGSERQAIEAFLNHRAVLVSERFKNIIGQGAGDVLSLTTPHGVLKIPIAGVFYDYTPNQCVVYLPRAIYQRYWKDNAIDGIALHLRRGMSTQQVQDDLQRRFGARYQLTLLPNREIRDSVFKTFDQTFAVTYALQLIAILVAAIGIFDTLIALLLERSRELATLRALGATGKQIQKMTFIEFALIAIFAWAIGMLAGLCLAWQLIYVINRQFFGWTIEWSLPPGVPLQALLLALVAALGAGFFPARAAARRHIATALQTE